MNTREKRLAIAVGALVALFGGVLMVSQILIKPLRRASAEADAVEEQLRRLKKERREFFAAEDRLGELARRTFADDANLASARSAEVLTRIIKTCGLNEADFSRLPFGPQIPRGAREVGWELGWNVQGAGELGKVIDFLFLLQKAPFLHRLDNVVLSSGREGRVKVRLKYLTLLIKSGPEVERTNDLKWLTLEDPARALYASIVERDFLSPYVEPPPPPPPPPVPSPPPGPTEPPPPGLETFRVVSLSEWQGQPEVHVHDSKANKTIRYKPGDALAGGVIVQVDYRELPKPGHQFLKSQSRVILKVGEEFWAVERGQTLAQKYKLEPEQLP